MAEPPPRPPKPGDSRVENVDTAPPTLPPKAVDISTYENAKLFTRNIQNVARNSSQLSRQGAIRVKTQKKSIEKAPIPTPRKLTVERDIIFNISFQYYTEENTMAESREAQRPTSLLPPEPDVIETPVTPNTLPRPATRRPIPSPKPFIPNASSLDTKQEENSGYEPIRNPEEFDEEHLRSLEDSIKESGPELPPKSRKRSEPMFSSNERGIEVSNCDVPDSQMAFRDVSSRQNKLFAHHQLDDEYPDYDIPKPSENQLQVPDDEREKRDSGNSNLSIEFEQLLIPPSHRVSDSGTSSLSIELDVVTCSESPESSDTVEYDIPDIEVEDIYETLSDHENSNDFEDRRTPEPPRRKESLPEFRNKTKLAPDFVQVQPAEEDTISLRKDRKSIFDKLKFRTTAMPSPMDQIYPLSPITPEIFQRPTFGTLITDELAANRGEFTIPGEKLASNVSLKNQILKWTSSESNKVVELKYLVSVGATNPPLVSPNGPAMYFLELSWYVPGIQKPQTQMLGAPNTLMRDIWMQQIFESTTECFPKYLTNSFTLAGWLYIRIGVTGDWVPCWMLLRGRELYYCVEGKPMQDADLRKARCILPKMGGGMQNNARYVWIDLQERSFYIQALSEKDTNRWGRNIRTAAHCNGAHLEHQQLTKDNVPVIVEKCVNFVSCRGLLLEGIYKKRGSGTAVTKLLEDLRRHAWSTSVTEANYTAHDVATALVKFFRKLPEPLVRVELASQLCGVANMNYSQDEDKIKRYRLILQQLPSIYYLTLKKLLGHFYFLQMMCSKNQVSATELASIWSPLLLRQLLVPQQKSGIVAVAEMITLYPKLYEISDCELHRELSMLSVIERLHGPARETVKDSGDLRVWITHGHPGAAEGLFVTVSPHKTAEEVCAELRQKSSCVLQEYVLGGTLRRPLHASERVLEVVVRWSYWPEEHRKDNQLVLAPCHLYSQILPAVRPSLSESGHEFKFADERNRNFKNFHFEISDGKLICYKDRKMNSKLHEWKIDEIVWYLGFEPKRDPESSWSITFIKRKYERQTKPNRYFGNTLAGSNHEDQLAICSALLLAEYPDDTLIDTAL